jgi:hypothetical protein
MRATSSVEDGFIGLAPFKLSQKFSVISSKNFGQATDSTESISSGD